MSLSLIFAVRKKIPQKLLVISVVISAALIFFVILGINQISKRKSIPKGWVKIGCDDHNTNFFVNTPAPLIKVQTPTKGKKADIANLKKQFFTMVWAAEEFSPLPFRLVGGVQKLNYNLRTCDLNRDGALEIIVGHQDQTLILDRNGVFQYALPSIFDIYQDDRGDIHLTICSLNIIQYKHNQKELKRLRTANPILSIRTAELKATAEPKLTFITIEKLRNENSNQFQIVGYDSESGQQLWLHQFELLPFISAIGDINQDGRNEIIGTTFSANQPQGEVFALSSSGKLIWQIRFNVPDNTHHQNYRVSAYTDAVIADLNGDGKMEVVAIFGTEDGKAGQIKVIDGKTGKIIDQFPKRRLLRRAFTSLAIADFDKDGKPDLVTSTRGMTARFYLFRMGTTGLETLATRRYFPPFIREPALISTLVWALADIDGDNELEILGSLVYESPVTTDWTVRTVQFFEPSVLVLDQRFQEKGYIDLEERCLAAVVSDVLRGSANEILILSDRLYLYALQ